MAVLPLVAILALVTVLSLVAVLSLMAVLFAFFAAAFAAALRVAVWVVGVRRVVLGMDRGRRWRGCRQRGGCEGF
jgi:hypothetical protein